MPDDEMGAYRDIFLSESAEYLQSIVDGLLALESNPGDSEPIETIFRGAHSLKGMAAAMGYEQTTDLTHRMESLMDTVRKGAQPVDSTLIDLMLRAVDAVKDLIDAESSDGGSFDVKSILAEIVARTEDGTPSGAQGSLEPAEMAGAPSTDLPVYRVRIRLSKDCVLKSVRAYMVLKRLNYIGIVLETDPSVQDIEDEKFGEDFSVVFQTGQSLEQIEDAASHVTDVESVDIGLEEAPGVRRPAKGKRAGAGSTASKLSDTQTVRVSISHLDSLVNLVGELVIVRSRFETLVEGLEDKGVREILEELSRISGELQREVMETRMVPVSNIFNRFPRMVRDLARDLGKEIRFEMAGLDIELDRTVLDEIGDPIVHLLRNAIDHGIEGARERISAGKSPSGLIRLEARREHDQVQIVVSDDGRGMDADAIWEKAIECRLVHPDARDTVSDEEILLLACESGFSTTREATKVSGRGFGMNVVKGKIEYLGGSLIIRSSLGEGVEFVMTLPLTLAIIQALLVSSGTSVFAIPLSAVSEVLPLDEAMVDTVDGNPVVVLREGDVVPLYRLDVITGAADDPTRMPEDREHIVLVEAGGQTRALAVDELMGRQDVVIKPLASIFKQIRGLGGVTVLGDGGIALILDPRSFFMMGEVAP